MPETKTPSVNEDLVKHLKQALAFAEKGDITHGVIVAFGPEIYHRTFAVPTHRDAVEMIGELTLFETELKVSTVTNRMAVAHATKPRILRPGH